MRRGAPSVFPVWVVDDLTALRLAARQAAPAGAVPGLYFTADRPPFPFRLFCVHAEAH